MAIMYDVQIWHEIFKRLFRDDAPLKYQAIEGSLYSEDDVDHSTSLDCYVVVNIIEDIRHESSTARCRQIVEILCF